MLRGSGNGDPAHGPLPSPAEIGALVEDFMTVLFAEPGRSGREHLAAALEGLEQRLEAAVYVGLHRRCPRTNGSDRCRQKARTVAERTLAGLPELQAMLALDVQAAFDA